MFLCLTRDELVDWNGSLIQNLLLLSDNKGFKESRLRNIEFSRLFFAHISFQQPSSLSCVNNCGCNQRAYAITSERVTVAMHQHDNKAKSIFVSSSNEFCTKSVCGFLFRAESILHVERVRDGTTSRNIWIRRIIDPLL